MPDLMSAFQDRLQRNVPLSCYTTFHLGGPARLFLEVHSEEELQVAMQLAHQEGIPFFLLGGGSNLVVADDGVDGLVIRNVTADPDRVDQDSGLIRVSSGRPLAHLVQVAAQHGLTGLESMTGIPGTVGGAVYGNAGAYGRCIGDLLVEAEILDEKGAIHRVGNDFFRFGYRTSALKEQSGVVAAVTVRTTRGDPVAIKTQMTEILRTRHTKHPPEKVGSAGSFFKNLPPLEGETRRRAAGEFLEKAGAKGMSVGGASVYKNHANFIVNYGQATARDVRELARLLREKVLSLFGIALEEEVLYLGTR